MTEQLRCAVSGNSRVEVMERGWAAARQFYGDMPCHLASVDANAEIENVRVNQIAVRQIVVQFNALFVFAPGEGDDR